MRSSAISAAPPPWDESDPNVHLLYPHVPYLYGTDPTLARCPRSRRKYESHSAAEARSYKSGSRSALKDLHRCEGMDEMSDVLNDLHHDVGNDDMSDVLKDLHIDVGIDYLSNCVYAFLALALSLGF